jgi:hypothetical protein
VTIYLLANRDRHAHVYRGNATPFIAKCRGHDLVKSEVKSDTPNESLQQKMPGTVWEMRIAGSDWKTSPALA